MNIWANSASPAGATCAVASTSARIRCTSSPRGTGRTSPGTWPSATTCAHPDVCAEYAALKRALAARYPYDIESYCDGKADFVKKYESLALAWAEGR